MLKKELTLFTFTPHITPMFRGILSTIYLDLKPGITPNNVQNILKKFHKKNKFVNIKSVNSFLRTNDVMNTNYWFISVCRTKLKDKIILLSVIDNLIKGGAGHAIQNMNLKFGYKISEGLSWKNYHYLFYLWLYLVLLFKLRKR